MASPPSPLGSILPAGPVSCATVLWRDRGELRLTAIVKATFSMVQDGAVSLVDPVPIYRDDVHHGPDPASSIAAASDLAPYLPFADIVLTGHARTHAGAMEEAVPLRLTIARDHILVDKRLHAVGDLVQGNHVPFERMPLVYERALGGAGSHDNPAGVGIDPADRRPNLVDPRAPGQCAGFGPISRTWPARTSLLTPEQRAGLERPIIEILDGFDWRYFHSAPADQCLAQLHGNEILFIDGMHPVYRPIRTQLPGARAEVLVQEAPGREPFLLPLRADSLHIDVDAFRCTLAFRGNLAVAREADLATARLFGGIALPSQPIPWPAQLRASAARAAAARSSRGAPALRHLPISEDRTRGLDDSSEAATNPYPYTDSGTLDLSEDDLPELQILALLSTQGHTLDPGVASIATALPFVGAPREDPRRDVPGAPLAPIPGAPWAPGTQVMAPSLIDAAEVTLVPDLAPMAAPSAPTGVALDERRDPGPTQAEAPPPSTPAWPASTPPEQPGSSRAPGAPKWGNPRRRPPRNRPGAALAEAQPASRRAEAQGAPEAPPLATPPRTSVKAELYKTFSNRRSDEE